MTDRADEIARELCPRTIWSSTGHANPCDGCKPVAAALRAYGDECKAPLQKYVDDIKSALNEAGVADGASAADEIRAYGDARAEEAWIRAELEVLRYRDKTCMPDRPPYGALSNVAERICALRKEATDGNP